MAKESNIVHQYFRKETGDSMILVKVNPILFTGTELTVPSSGKLQLREFEFDEEYEAALVANGYQPAGPMEFNLYLNGLS